MRNKSKMEPTKEDTELNSTNIRYEENSLTGNTIEQSECLSEVTSVAEQISTEDTELSLTDVSVIAVRTSEITVKYDRGHKNPESVCTVKKEQPKPLYTLLPAAAYTIPHTQEASQVRSQDSLKTTTVHSIPPDEAVIQWLYEWLAWRIYFRSQWSLQHSRINCFVQRILDRPRDQGAMLTTHTAAGSLQGTCAELLLACLFCQPLDCLLATVRGCNMCVCWFCSSLCGCEALCEATVLQRLLDMSRLCEHIGRLGTQCCLCDCSLCDICLQATECLDLAMEISQMLYH